MAIGWSFSANDNHVAIIRSKEIRAWLVSRNRPAISIIEVLVVISLIGILIGLLVPAVQRVRETANMANCNAHLKDLVLAVHSYESTNGKMPPYASGRPREMIGGWYMHLLPYVGHADLYDILKENQITTRNGIQVVTNGMYLPQVKNANFPELVCASDPTRHESYGDNATNYVANWYALSDGIRGTYRRARRFDSLTNGLSNVVLFAEAYSDCDGLHRLALYSSYYHNFGITQQGMPSADPHYAPNDYLMFQESPKHCDKWRTQTAHSLMPVALADGSTAVCRRAFPSRRGRR